MSVKELFSLKGKVAIVTGGGRGLGQAMAVGLAEAGADVVVCSRKKEACEKVAAELNQVGVRSLPLSCDVTQPESVDSVVEQTMAHFGQIDILVNNSGVSWGASPETMPLEKFRMVLDVNVTGTFLMCQAVGKEMIKRRYGKIINISSIAGQQGIDPRVMNAIGYHASKGAVSILTKDLAAKWAEHNICVNAIAPGFFPTKMSLPLIERFGERLLEQTPLRRFGSTEDIQGVCLFLASAASNYVTGAVIPVDGGLSAI